MAKDVIVSEQLAQKFASEKETPYTRWVASEGLDILSGHFVKNLNTVELKPWARRGGKAVFINHDASRTSNDCYVCEIPAGGKLEPQRQLCEEMLMILSGRGSTSVWNDTGAKVTFEWGPGAIFAIPLNAGHQHFNGSGREPVRFVAVTNLPPVMNLYEDPGFIFNTSFDFKNRFSGEPDYFANKGEQKERPWQRMRSFQSNLHRNSRPRKRPPTPVGWRRRDSIFSAATSSRTSTQSN